MELLLQYGPAVLFGIVFIEQLGVPIPAAPFLLAAGGLAGTGHTSSYLGLAAALAGCLAADGIWFEIGRRQGMKVLQRLCNLSMNPNVCVRRTENTFAKYGIKTLLGSKFVPGLNALSAPLAGMFNIRFRRFILFDAAGALMYLGMYFSLGWIFHEQVEKVVEWLENLGRGAIWVVAGIVGAFILYKLIYRQWVLYSLRMARIKPEELQLLSAGNKDLYYILDLRSMLDVKELPYRIPGSVHILPDEIEMRHPEIPRDRDIIVYCACPNETTASKVAIKLRKKGIKKIRPLLGGIIGWRYQELPLEPYPTSDSNE